MSFIIKLTMTLIIMTAIIIMMTFIKKSCGWRVADNVQSYAGVAAVIAKIFAQTVAKVFAQIHIYIYIYGYIELYLLYKYNS